VDIATIILAITTIAGGIIYMKWQNSKNVFLDLLGDLAEAIIFAHAIFKGEIPWNEENRLEGKKMTEEIWEELKVLGPNIAAYLKSMEP
jgi:hypothetical protein